MELRRPKTEDLETLRKLHEPFKDQFKFPDFSLLSSIYVAVDEDDKILGFGSVQPIFEAVLVLDLSASVDERLLALDMLESRAEFELKTQGISQIHAFVQLPLFENLLKNRFEFKPTKGKALVKCLDS